MQKEEQSEVVEISEVLDSDAEVTDAPARPKKRQKRLSSVTLEKKVYFPDSPHTELIRQKFTDWVNDYVLQNKDIRIEIKGRGMSEDPEAPLHACLRGQDPMKVGDALKKLQMAIKGLVMIMNAESNAPAADFQRANGVQSPTKMLASKINTTPKFRDLEINPEETAQCLEGLVPTDPNLEVGQVILLIEDKGFGIIRVKDATEIYFRLSEVEKCAHVCHGDIVECAYGPDPGAGSREKSKNRATKIQILRQAIIGNYDRESITFLLEKYQHLPVRTVLLNITARPIAWRNLLMTKMPSDGSQMIARHVLQILDLSVAVSRSVMSHALKIYFSLFFDSNFVVNVIPKLLRSKHLSGAVLDNIAILCVSVKKYAGVTTGIRMGKVWLKTFPECRKARLDLYKQFDWCERMLKQSSTEILTEEEEVRAAQPPDKCFRPHDPFLSESFPTADEFKDPSVYLPENLPKIEKQGAYQSPLDYIQSHYRLMKAECFSEFVQCIHYNFFADEETTNELPPKIRDGLMRCARFYASVHIVGANFTGKTGQSYSIHFTHPDQKKMNWAKTTHLDRGNVVCFTTDRFQSELWWAVISDRTPALLQGGILSVEFLKGSAVELQQKILRNINEGREKDNFMAESTIFFQGYRPILEAIGSQAINPRPLLSFQHALVEGSGEPVVPKYLSSPGRKERLEAIIQDVLNKSTFDAGQKIAVTSLSSRNFILVQGPPGTGKSYTGVKMAEILAQFREEVMADLQKSSCTELLKLDSDIEVTHMAMIELENKHKPICTKLQESERRKATMNVAKMTNTPGYAQVQRDIKDLTANKKEIERQLAQLDMAKRELLNVRSQRQVELGTDKLAHNQEFGPMVVITFKNHALDEFLGDALDWLDQREASSSEGMFSGIVRIGSRSKSEKLEAYNLKALSRKEVDKVRPYRKRWLLQREAHISRMKAVANKILASAGDVTPEIMHHCLTQTQKLMFGAITLDSIKEWLGRYSHDFVATYNSMVPAIVKNAQIWTRELKHVLEMDSDGIDDEGVGPTISNAKGIDQDEVKQNQRFEETFLDTWIPFLPEGYPCMTEKDTLADLYMMTAEERRQFAFRMIGTYHKELLEEYAQARDQYQAINKRTNELIDQCQRDVLNKANIIGLTTSGAAIYRDLLQDIKPSIMIVEEAAEILESQLLSCIANIPVQQLVLIGDHKQLKPTVQVYAHSLTNQLDLSMFERMAANNVPCIQLTTQRRMTPQICQFAMPIYPNQLESDASVLRRELRTGNGPVRTDMGETCKGMVKNIFFWTHKNPECPSSMGMSQMNTVEITMIEELVGWLIGVSGISAEQITILTPYKGQMKEIRKRLGRDTDTGILNIHTVDRYQGDENDIVLLSMVRSANLTEFVRRQDRMVVALSRARYAMYVVGNFDLLNNDELPHWKESLDQFLHPTVPFTGSPLGDTRHTKSNAGEKFPVCCPVHPNQIWLVAPGDRIHRDSCKMCNPSGSKKSWF